MSAYRLVVDDDNDDNDDDDDMVLITGRLPAVHIQSVDPRSRLSRSSPMPSSRPGRHLSRRRAMVT